MLSRSQKVPNTDGLPASVRAAPKLFRRGTHRIVSPTETLLKALEHRAAFGLTRVANITGLDTLGIPVWTACRPNARSLSVSQGKGVDDEAAKASAVMESIEAFHAERIALPLKFASYQEISADHTVVDVKRLCKTGRPFEPSLAAFWIEAADFTTGAGIWVPFETVHLNYTMPALPGSGYFVASSNGLASGNHPLEAISHALCELIERDATTLWFVSGQRGIARTRVDLATVDDPMTLDVLARYERADVGVAVWDTTSDVGIPSFSCSIADRADNPMRPLTIARGMGCHPSRDVALLRALTEAAQSRLTVISGARDDLTDSRYAVNQVFDDRERLRRLICDTAGTRDLHSVPTWDGQSVDEDVAIELERLSAVGLKQVLCVDLTRPEFEIPVFRVLVPGLEALYDVPGYLAGERARARKTALEQELAAQ